MHHSTTMPFLFTIGESHKVHLCFLYFDFIGKYLDGRRKILANTLLGLARPGLNSIPQFHQPGCKEHKHSQAIIEVKSTRSCRRRRHLIFNPTCKNEKKKNNIFQWSFGRVEHPLHCSWFYNEVERVSERHISFRIIWSNKIHYTS